MSNPRVLVSKPATGVAGQIALLATVRYEGEEPHGVTFVGSTYGTPGPVVMIQGGHQTFVTDPGRFGDTLDAGWVRRFFGGE